MDVKDYCLGLEAELMAWKAKLYDAIVKTDALAGDDNEKILSNISELKELIANIENQVMLLKTECPSDWSPHKKEIDDSQKALRNKYDEYLDLIGKASFSFQPGFPTFT